MLKYPIKKICCIYFGEWGRVKGNPHNLIRDGCHGIRGSRRRMYLREL